MGVEEAIKLNCSTIFLLPGIGHQRRQLLKYGFIAAYIDDKNHEPHYRNAVYMLFRPPDMDAFQIFLDNEYETLSRRYDRGKILDEYDYGKGYVVVVYGFPERYLSDYRLFLEGKYSRFSEEYKDLFPKKIDVLENDGSVTEQFSLPYLIFNKVKSLKEFWEEKMGVALDSDSEYWMLPNTEGKEALDITEFYKRL